MTQINNTDKSSHDNVPSEQGKNRKRKIRPDVSDVKVAYGDAEKTEWLTHPRMAAVPNKKVQVFETKMN